MRVTTAHLITTRCLLRSLHHMMLSDWIRQFRREGDCNKCVVRTAVLPQALDQNALWMEQLSHNMKMHGFFINEHYAGKGTGMTATAKWVRCLQLNDFLEAADAIRMGTTCDVKPSSQRVLKGRQSTPPMQARRVLHLAALTHSAGVQCICHVTSDIRQRHITVACVQCQPDVTASGPLDGSEDRVVSCAYPPVMYMIRHHVTNATHCLVVSPAPPMSCLRRTLGSGGSVFSDI